MKTSGALRILLVDNSKGDAVLIDRALRHCMPETGDIRCANTLAVSLKMLAEEEFDVAILDRSLPDAADNNGLQSIKNMAPKMPVVFLTGNRNEQAAVEAIELGAQDYIFKDDLDGAKISRAIQFAIIRKRFENTLVAQANYDHLTGLATRLLFENRLGNAMAKMKRSGHAVGILFLDLNRFKPVNDSHGHAIGDMLLKDVGARLKSCLRPYDTAARIGGDEFAVLIEDVANIDERCAAVAHKLLAAIDQPFEINGRRLSIGVSVGIATSFAGDNCTSAELIRHADAAMYEAKQSPDSHCRFWTGPARDMRQSVA